MSIYKKDALDVIAYNEMTPEVLMDTILHSSHSLESTESSIPHCFLKDETATTWLFIIRRRCHIYLMAKHPLMDGYVEILKKKNSIK